MLRCEGFDSILAQGQQEPDPKKDTTIKIESQAVAVPQAPPVLQPTSATSSLCQSQYLVYKKARQRLRYVLTFEWC
jgi:poly [ADP-ribose] polymerase 2/3/4